MNSRNEMGEMEPGRDAITGDTLREVDLDGDECRAAVTSLLLQARGDDPMAGLWEAADLQWWWSVDHGRGSRRDTFWLDPGGRPVACLLTSRQKGGYWVPGSAVVSAGRC